MTYKDDGTPISSNSIMMGRSDKAFNNIEMERMRLLMNRAVEIHLATVTDILFADDEDNQSQNQVEYSIQIEFGDRSGQEYNNVKAINLYGGMVQISETVYYPRTQTLKNKPDKDNIYMFDHDGSQVIVGFMDGFANRPVILGGWANTNSSPLFAATEDDGIRKMEEFNGIRLNIDKDGQYILTYFGGQRDTKTFETENADTAPTFVMIDKTGAWSVEDRQNQRIKLDQTAQTIVIEQVEDEKDAEEYGTAVEPATGNQVNAITLDKKNKTVSIKIGDHLIVANDTEGSESISLLNSLGSIINMDKTGSIKVVSKDGSTVYLNADTNEISIIQKDGNIIGMNSKGITISDSTGKQTMAIDGSMIQLASSKDLVENSQGHTISTGSFNVKGGGNVTMKDMIGGELNIKNGMVALGNDAAELLDLFDQLVSEFMTVLTGLASSAITAGPFPVAPPLATAVAPSIPKVVKIKILLALIKGSL